jgi:hypothetical protein
MLTILSVDEATSPESPADSLSRFQNEKQTRAGRETEMSEI